MSALSPADGPLPLEGRVAIVTGGARGIGEALSEGLAAAGASVVVTGRTAERCDAVAGAIVAKGGMAVSVPGDVTVEADRTRVLEIAETTFGGLDILINNAGVLRPHATVKVREDELDGILALNLKAPLFLSCAALPLLEKSGHGSIVNISALGAFQPMEGLGAYCAVKAAIANWTTTMSREWAPRKVRVNLLVPGPVATDMILPRDPAKREEFVATMSAGLPVGRLAEPKDLVGAAVFLAGDASAFMTGRALFMDGGMLR